MVRTRAMMLLGTAGSMGLHAAVALGLGAMSTRDHASAAEWRAAGAPAYAVLEVSGVAATAARETAATAARETAATTAPATDASGACEWTVPRSRARDATASPASGAGRSRVAAVGPEPGADVAPQEAGSGTIERAASVSASVPVALPDVPASAAFVDAEFGAWRASVSELLGARLAQTLHADGSDLGAEGTVLLAVHVAASGGLASVSVARSSGHAGLDARALGAVRAIGHALPPPPAAFVGRLAPLRVPVRFRTRAATSTARGSAPAGSSPRGRS